MVESFIEFYCRTKRDTENMIHKAAQPWYDTFSTMPKTPGLKDLEKRFREEEQRRLWILEKMMPGNCGCIIK